MKKSIFILGLVLLQLLSYSFVQAFFDSSDSFECGKNAESIKQSDGKIQCACKKGYIWSDFNNQLNGDCIEDLIEKILEGSPTVSEDFSQDTNQLVKSSSLFDDLEASAEYEKLNPYANIPPFEANEYLTDMCQEEGNINIFGKFCLSPIMQFILAVLIFGFIIIVITWVSTPSEPIDNDTCRKCGKKFQLGDIFCSKCGSKGGFTFEDSPETKSVSSPKNGGINLDYKYASFGRRLFAHIVDLVLNLLVIPVFINIYSYYKDNQTIGDSVMGIQVFNDDLKDVKPSGGQLTGRFVSKFISAMTLGIGYIMILFTRKKQALHDKMAGTVIREVGEANWAGAIVIIIIGFIVALFLSSL